jgi:hypothetical protein
VANWSNRLKPIKGRAGIDLMTSAALLLLVSGPQALAEDEPAARAPLPPLLQGAPAEAGERQMRDPAPSRNQSDPRPPAIRLDRPKFQLSQKKPRLHSASYLGTSVAKKREAPAQFGNHSKHADSRRRGHSAVAFQKSQRRERSPAEPGIGRLSPRATIPIRRSGAPTSPQRSHDKLHPSIIPITSPVRPHMVMPRTIRMHGHYPDLGSFGKGRPSPECRTPP